MFTFDVFPLFQALFDAVALCAAVFDILFPFIDVIITSLINHLLPLISSFTSFDISFYSVDASFALCDPSTLCDLLLVLLVVLTPLRHTSYSSSLINFFHSQNTLL